MGKLNKQSSGVGKYLKYHKEKITGGNLPNVIQQTKAKICPECGAKWRAITSPGFMVHGCK